MPSLPKILNFCEIWIIEVCRMLNPNNFVIPIAINE